MNQFLRKWNSIIVMLVIVLFTNIAYAAGFTEEDYALLDESIVFYDSFGEIQDVPYMDSTGLEDFTYSGATLTISSESLRALADRGITVRYGTNEEDDKFPTLWATKYDSESQKYIYYKISLQHDGRNIQFSMASIDTQKCLGKNDAERDAAAGTGFDWILTPGAEGTMYAFAPYDDALGPFNGRRK